MPEAAATIRRFDDPDERPGDMTAGGSPRWVTRVTPYAELGERLAFGTP